MSKENLQAFYQEFRVNLELQKQLQGMTDIGEFANKAVELGASKGFNFTVADVEAALADPSAFLEESIGEELNDMELLQVSGGANPDLRAVLGDELHNILAGNPAFCSKT